MKSVLTSLLALSMIVPAGAETVINVQKEGADKVTVQLNVPKGTIYSSLARNLDYSGVFILSQNGAVKVSRDGEGRLVAEGNGHRVSLPASSADEAAQLKAARQFADALVATYSKQKGFATKPFVFISKNGQKEEVCTAYADGLGVRRVTNDGKPAVGPRWASATSVYYTGYLSGCPQIFEVNTETGSRQRKWAFKGLTTGAAPSPNGRDVAMILSVHGDPDLYLIDSHAGTWRRLTNTKGTTEGQPSWSPDGAKLAFVSDATKRQHIYVMNPADKKAKRLTQQGTQNVDPDWGENGLIAYTTKRGGDRYIAIMSPESGDAQGRLVTKGGQWEHPTWAPDGVHVLAESGGVLYLIDTREEGDEPKRILSLNGAKCITPSWSK